MLLLLLFNVILTLASVDSLPSLIKELFQVFWVTLHNIQAIIIIHLSKSRSDWNKTGTFWDKIRFLLVDQFTQQYTNQCFPVGL